MTVDHHDARPLHMRVADDLRRKVLSGEFAVGTKLPSLRALAEKYAVSEVTAHTAVRSLQHEGVLQSTSGRGTFVTAVPTVVSESRTIQAQLTELRSEITDLNRRMQRLESHAQESTPKRNG